MLIRASCVLLFLTVVTHNAFGCMCGSISVCDAYTQASAVVIAEVVSIERDTFSFEERLAGGREMKVTAGTTVKLRVYQWFKGRGHKTIKVVKKNSTCDWMFGSSQLKTKFLFYLSYSEKTREYSVVPCGRSDRFARSHDDLSWLNGLPGSLKRTRISGVTQTFEDDVFSRLPSVKLQISGSGGKTSLASDTAGLYEIWDVSAGKYRITAEAPPDLGLDWTSSVPENRIYFWSFGVSDLAALDVTLEPGKCAGIDFTFKKK